MEASALLEGQNHVHGPLILGHPIGCEPARRLFAYLIQYRSTRLLEPGLNPVGYALGY